MKIIFLDRDGVINTFPGVGHYVTSIDQFEFIPGSLEAIQILTAMGYEINVISNQGCISKGLMTIQELDFLTQKMTEEIQKAGGRLSGVYYCTHQTSDACECHKPKTALFHQALKGRSVFLESLYFIGDSSEDMQAGKNLGCRTILVLSGRVQKHEISDLPAKPHHIMQNLLEAVLWLKKHS